MTTSAIIQDIRKLAAAYAAREAQSALVSASASRAVSQRDSTLPGQHSPGRRSAGLILSEESQVRPPPSPTRECTCCRGGKHLRLPPIPYQSPLPRDALLGREPAAGRRELTAPPPASVGAPPPLAVAPPGKKRAAAGKGWSCLGRGAVRQALISLLQLAVASALVFGGLRLVNPDHALLLPIGELWERLNVTARVLPPLTALSRAVHASFTHPFVAYSSAADKVADKVGARAQAAMDAGGDGKSAAAPAAGECAPARGPASPTLWDVVRTWLERKGAPEL
jgi:hypothetical protein